MQLKDNSNVALIQAKGFKFLITDKPSNYTMTTYIKILKMYHVSGVVRVCDPTYDTDLLIKAGLDVYSLVYEDGMYPPGYVIDDWFKIIKKQFKTDPNTCLAVHCVAGLGRAPVMVALTLIELGIKFEHAIEIIRSKKRGAINTKQLRFLEKYRPSGKLQTSRFCCIQ